MFPVGFFFLLSTSMKLRVASAQNCTAGTTNENTESKPPFWAEVQGTGICEIENVRRVLILDFLFFHFSLFFLLAMSQMQLQSQSCNVAAMQPPKIP